MVIGLALVAVLSLTLAWWALPGDVDVQEVLTPSPGSVTPPSLPPVDDPTALDESDTDADSTAAGSSGSEDVGASFDGSSDTDLAAGVARTEDGLPVARAESILDVGPTLPAEGRLVRLVGHATTLLGVVETPRGSVVMVLSVDGKAEGRSVRLTGVSPSGVEAARARDPVWSGDRWLLLGESAGASNLWELNLETVEARPIPRPESPGRLSHLAQDQRLLGVVVGERSVWLRDEGAWSLREGGARPISALDVASGPRAVGARSGSVFLVGPRYSVARSVGIGAEPVFFKDDVLLVRSGEVLLQSGDRLTSLGAVAALPGPDIVADGDSAIWLRPDGRLGRLRAGQLDAIEVDLDQVDAIGINGELLSVAGTGDGVRRVLIAPVPERDGAIAPADLRSSPP